MSLSFCPYLSAEFNELFLDRIAEGLELTENLSESKNNVQMIKKYASILCVNLLRRFLLTVTPLSNFLFCNSMFQGEAVEYLNATESDGTPIETIQDGIVVAHLVSFNNLLQDNRYTCCKLIVPP